MFERRLKIFLFVLLALGALVLGRSAQVQILDHRQWQDQAAATIPPPEFLETTRGRIMDYRGRPIAYDAPCSDVCVAYPAILGTFTEPSDRRWLRDLAVRTLRLNASENAHFSTTQIKAEMARLKVQIAAMWPVLAREGGESVEQLDQTRQAIIAQVEMRRRYLWHLNYKLANQKTRDDDSNWLARWLSGNSNESIDKFDMVIASQTADHPILTNVDASICNQLAKHADEYPGLVIRKSTVRYYPFGAAAAQVIGHLSAVNKSDLKGQAGSDSDDLGRYFLNDQIGRTGIEAMEESILRGRRGKIIPGNDERPQQTTAAIPGGDVTTTIDIELERQIQDLFHHTELTQARPAFSTVEDMNGAAVVIDIPTGQVRAMVSNPSYDPNRLAQEYSTLAADEFRRPLMNRATQMALEPGSTVKPMVGIGAITSGVATVQDTVACDGYLVLRGHKYTNIARCWIAKLGMPHHSIGEYLTFPDALEQSCNVYFETMADRLGMERLAHYYSLFGLGRPTGIGLDEVPGRIPSVAATPPASLMATTWFCGIGQTEVLATPLQMCNVAATVARDGIWMRPKIVEETGENNAASQTSPDEVDLHLSKAALAAAREGMTRVVNAPTGTGRQARLDDVLMAGKTGTAQAAKFTIARRDTAGNLIKDAKGNIEYDTIQPSTFEHVNPQAPWYWAWGADGSDLSHAWFIGFAPADKPKLAIAVMVEYGGGGGATAGRLAARIIQACIDDGYIQPEPGR